jgi:hypothetical protein
MSIHTFFKSLASTSTRRRPARLRPLPSRLYLEPLEDRCLLSFSPAVSYAVGTTPQAVLTADFNSDGRLDLAVANYSSNNISVLLGNAGGTFQAAQNSTVGAPPVSTEVGDFNADGRLDLATVNDSDVSVLLGNGNGTFQPALNTAFNPYYLYTSASLTVGELNGDGQLDVVVTTSERVPETGVYSCVTVLLGNGDGTFGAPNARNLSDMELSSAVLQDFNADGRLDLATTDTHWPVAWLFAGNGDGTFGGSVGYGTSGSRLSVVVGDVNGDGVSDLITRNSVSVSVLFGNGSAGAGDGTFQPALNTALSFSPASLAFGDFNADGKLDLVAANAAAGTVSVLPGTGTGLFRPPVDAVTGTAPRGLAVGDFNGDGRPDVASANSGSNNVSVLLNDGNWPATDTPAIAIDDVTVTEGNSGMTVATFTVSLSAAYSQTVSVYYETESYWDGATAGVDYQASAGTLTFAPGVTSQTIAVLVNGDRVYESNESFYVRLSDPTNAFVVDDLGTGTIVDDEPYVSIEPYVSGAEGNTGTTPFTFTVTLSAVSDVPVTVDYATADFTDEEAAWWGISPATAGVDYVAASGTLIFAACQTSQTITVLVHGDRLLESNEWFLVNLSNSGGLPISNSQAGGEIVDDETLISINSGVSVVEGNTGTSALTFTVTLTAASTDPVTVSYATADGSATAASGDYQALSGTLTFAPGETSKTVTVLVNGDRLGETNESVYVNLTSASGAYFGNGRDRGMGTILDDEPRISVSDVTKAEGKKGQTTLFTFTVTLSAAYDQPVTVSYRTADGTARAGEDYAVRTGTITFAPGETTKTITIEVKGDSKKEVNEMFYLDLFGNSGNSLFTKNRGIGTILNDD